MVRTMGPLLKATEPLELEPLVPFVEQAGYDPKVAAGCSGISAFEIVVYPLQTHLCLSGVVPNSAQPFLSRDTQTTDRSQTRPHSQTLAHEHLLYLQYKVFSIYLNLDIM
jgi:hypothetical protein